MDFKLLREKYVINFISYYLKCNILHYNICSQFAKLLMYLSLGSNYIVIYTNSMAF